MNQVELPESNSAERYILTAILNDADNLLDISNQITYKDFSNPFYANVFRICLQMVERSEVPEPMSVYNKLDAIGEAEPQDLKNLEFMRRATWEKANIQGNVDEVRAVSTRRKLILAHVQTIGELQEQELAPDMAVALAENKILDIGAEATRSIDIIQMGCNALEVLEERANNPIPLAGIPTGFPDLDVGLQGLQNGRLYVVCARQKTGKSMFLLNAAAYAAIECDTPVLWLDTEMPSHQVQDRFLSLVSGVDEIKIKNGSYVEDKYEYEKLKVAAQKLAGASIYHHYMPSYTFETCLSLAKQYVVQKGVGLIIFDYIKEPDNADIKSRREDQFLGTITSNFKNKIAGALDVPVLTAAQMGRKGIDATEATDDMVADSDRIGRYADVVMFLREKTEREREEYGANRQVGNMILHVQVSRYTEAKDTSYDIWFDKPKMKMEEKRSRQRR